MLNFRQQFVNLEILGRQLGQGDIVLHPLSEIRRPNPSRIRIDEIALGDAPRCLDDRLDSGEKLLCQSIHRNVVLQQTIQDHRFPGGDAHALAENGIETT